MDREAIAAANAQTWDELASRMERLSHYSAHVTGVSAERWTSDIADAKRRAATWRAQIA